MDDLNVRSETAGHNRPDLLFGDLYLAICELLDPLKGPLEVLVLEYQLKFFEGIGKPGSTGVLAEDDLACLPNRAPGP